jgi:hypothetical protein
VNKVNHIATFGLREVDWLAGGSPHDAVDEHLSAGRRDEVAAWLRGSPFAPRSPVGPFLERGRHVAAVRKHTLSLAIACALAFWSWQAIRGPLFPAAAASFVAADSTAGDVRTSAPAGAGSREPHRSEPTNLQPISLLLLGTALALAGRSLRSRRLADGPNAGPAEG